MTATDPNLTSPQPATDDNSQIASLRSFGGVLYLIAALLIISCVQNLMFVIGNAAAFAFFTSAHPQALFQDIYFVASLFFVVLYSYTTLIFFKKSPRFPAYFTFITIASCATTAAAVYMKTFVLGLTPEDIFMRQQLPAMMVSIGIWLLLIIYVNRSRRAKAVFSA